MLPDQFRILYLSRFDDVLRGMRLTLTGGGIIAKSLAEKQQGHEDILRAVKDILVHLTQKESRDA